MNVYDAERMADVLAPRGLCRDRRRPRTPTSSSSTPAISARRRPRRSIPSSAGCASSRRSAARARRRDDRRRRLRRPGRGRRDPAARAGASTSSSGRRPITACPSCCARAKRGERRRHRISGRGQVRPPAGAARAEDAARAASPPSSPCRKAATSSAPSASCPIRAARKSRGRSRRSSPRPSGSPEPACARSRCSARTSTPITATGRTGRDWGSGRLLAAARRDPGHRPPALHDQPSARHGRRADRRASRPAGADALSASAGAVGLGPHPRGDEPPAHGATTICALIERVRAARPDIALSSDFIVGFPGETDADFEATLALVARRSASPRPSPSSIRPRPGTPAADAGRPGRRDGEGRAARARCRRCSTRSGRRSTAPRVGRTRRRPVREARPPSRPDRRPVALSAAGAGRGAASARSATIVPRADRRRPAPNSLFGATRRSRAADAARMRTSTARSTRVDATRPRRRPPASRQRRDRRSPSTTTGSPARVFGQYDQNLAMLERRLGVDATPRGNHVAHPRPPEACEQARRVLETLYARAQARPGHRRSATSTARSA